MSERTSEQVNEWPRIYARPTLACSEPLCSDQGGKIDASIMDLYATTMFFVPFLAVFGSYE